MGRRFKEISTGDGWRKIVRLHTHSPTATGHHHRNSSGKYRSFNANHLGNGNILYQCRNYYAKSYDHANALYQKKHPISHLTSLLPYSTVSHLTNNSHYTSPILTLLQTELTTLSNSPNQQSTMTKKKQTYISVSKNNPSTDTRLTPGRTFATATTPPNNIHLIQNPFRYPQPIWKSYLDANPWTFASPSNVNLEVDNPLDQLEPLPLSPEATHPRCKRRCCKCLVIGHDQNECTRTERVCARCWHTGHAARNYTYTLTSKTLPFDPLMQQRNMGDQELPKDRPCMTMVFIPETNKMQNDACKMLRAIVIDTRLREHHNLLIL